MRVLKFGGSSVGSCERIENVLQIVCEAQRDRGPVAVVVSAFGGVTDELIAISKTAASGDQGYKTRLTALENRHVDALRHFVPVVEQSPVLLTLKMWFNDLEDVLHGVYLVGELSRRCSDYITSFGELLSAQIVSRALRAKNIDSEFLDAREVIKTDDQYGCARVLFRETQTRVAEHFKDRAALQVMTGFIASTMSGETTTLGRGGSDYSASILAAALDSAEVEIWTDVDGLMTADPTKVPKAFSVRNLSYEEAMELSHFGAKVIYPPTMQPALDKHIPIRILNTFNPHYPGTVVSHMAEEDRPPVTGISSISRIALMRVEGSGMVGVAGVSKRLFGALAEMHINVILITQASSEHTICFAVRPEDAERAAHAVEREFALEIQAKFLNQVVVEDNLAIVSVVGEQMRNTPGLAGRVFHALGKNGVNVSAIAQGSSELNISAVIPRSDEIKALNALHDEFFFPDKRTINIFLAGTGLIGGELLKQIEAQREYLREELAHEVNVIGIVNTRKMMLDPKGISIDRCRTLLESSSEGGDIARFITQMRDLNMPSSVFVDCTASPDVVAHYEEILRASVSIVTPNKKAQSGPYPVYAALKRAARRRGVAFLYETSVGAGLPVLSTLNDLLKSGDEILRIEAVLSGTLSFIFNSYRAGTCFSEIVAQARAAGYTEPDPRDDLNGLDVARKILILARESGCCLELDQVDVQNLVPEDCRQTASVDEFFAKLREHDGAFEAQRSEAEARGEKLCYIASLEDGTARVRLQRIASTHPFFGLSGSDNIISFTTRRYRERPLVVKGPGAGAEVTAAGVFADIVRIAS